MSRKNLGLIAWLFGLVCGSVVNAPQAQHWPFWVPFALGAAFYLPVTLLTRQSK